MQKKSRSTSCAADLRLKPEYNKSGLAHSSSSQAGLAHSSSSQAGLAHSSSSQAGLAHSSSSQAGLAHSSSSQAGLAHSSSGQTGLTHSSSITMSVDEPKGEEESESSGPEPAVSLADVKARFCQSMTTSSWSKSSSSAHRLGTSILPTGYTSIFFTGQMSRHVTCPSFPKVTRTSAQQVTPTASPHVFPLQESRHVSNLPKVSLIFSSR